MEDAKTLKQRFGVLDSQDVIGGGEKRSLGDAPFSRLPPGWSAGGLLPGLWIGEAGADEARREAGNTPETGSSDEKRRRPSLEIFGRFSGFTAPKQRSRQ